MWAAVKVMIMKQVYLIMCGVSFQYGEDGDIKSFLVEVKWTDNYPDELPNVNLDAFYNKHM